VGRQAEHDGSASNRVGLAHLTKEINMTEKEYLNGLIADHWHYVECMLQAHGVEERDIDLARFHYWEAFKHGWKHHGEYLLEIEEQQMLDAL
jgi:hypothetical protein